MRLLRAIRDRVAAFHKARRRAMRTYLSICTLIAISALIYWFWNAGPPDVPTTTVTYSEFMDKIERDEVVSVRINLELYTAKLKDGKYIASRVSAPANPLPDLQKHRVKVDFDSGADPESSQKRLYITLGILAVVGLWFWLYFGAIGPRGEIRLIFWRKAKKFGTVTFDDVAGIDEVKLELQEVVEFLKDPSKYKRVGSRVPRGVLLVGPPGVGKTLIARAVAGEAGVPFHAMSGSDFVEMYVGVGASRVRGLFDKAKEQTPCIIYIDEVDSVATRRGTISQGGDREYGQTTNQLLTELDGFEKNEDIVFIASTNNLENLDEAFLRPGRLDRKVQVQLPDAKGREQILAVHTKKLKLDTDVDLTLVALATPGFSGADLANLANEAGIFAAREGAEKVAKRHFELARDKVLMGEQQKSRVLTEEDKWLIAVHEVGHAIVAMRSPGADPVEKISSMPRGKSLGVMIQLPTEDRVHYKKSFLVAKLAIMMGGRAAEEVFFGGDVSAGAKDDIVQATRLANAMVSELGMSDQIGPLSLRGSNGHYHCSADFARLADEEVRDLVTKGLKRARSIIEKERAGIERVAKELVRKNDLSGAEIKALLAEEPPQNPN